MRELLFALIETRPEFQDAKRCRRRLVGAMRRHLARHGGGQLLDWPDLPVRALTLIRERMAAADELADFCARCGRCETEKIFE